MFIWNFGGISLIIFKEEELFGRWGCYLVIVFFIFLEFVKYIIEWKCKWLVCFFYIFVIVCFNIFIDTGIYIDRGKGKF